MLVDGVLLGVVLDEEVLFVLDEEVVGLLLDLILIEIVLPDFGFGAVVDFVTVGFVAVVLVGELFRDVFDVVLVAVGFLDDDEVVFFELLLLTVDFEGFFEDDLVADLVADFGALFSDDLGVVLLVFLLVTGFLLVDLAVVLVVVFLGVVFFVDDFAEVFDLVGFDVVFFAVSLVVFDVADFLVELVLFFAVLVLEVVGFLLVVLLAVFGAAFLAVVLSVAGLVVFAVFALLAALVLAVVLALDFDEEVVADFLVVFLRVAMVMSFQKERAWKAYKSILSRVSGAG